MTQSQETVRDAEQRLWSKYLLAVSRCQCAEVKYDKAWREYVVSDGDVTCAGKWDELDDAWKDARQQVADARLAWQRVAYPEHGFTVREDT